MFAVVSLWGHFIIQPDMEPGLAVVRYALAIVFLAALIATLAWRGREDRDLHVFLMQSLAAVALVFLLATSMFPNLVVAVPGSAGASITVATASSTDLALAWMTGIACIGVPLVLVYHIYVYRTFRGRLELE